MLSGGAYSILHTLSLPSDNFYAESILEVGLCLNLCVSIYLNLFPRSPLCELTTVYVSY